MITTESLADQLDALSRQVASLQSQFASQEQAALEAALSPADVLRVGSYPSGADVYPAGTTTPGFENILADNSVVPGTIAPGAIDSIAKFASTIRPPVVVGALPTLPDALYPSGSLVFLTTNKKLYKTETGLVGSWITVVNTTDLTGTITETQIADDAISTPKLKANSITAAKIAVGTITATEIATDTITAGQIAAGAIGASEVAANAITADKLSVGGYPQITNPDFETGDLTGWTSAVTSGAVSVSTAAANAQSGVCSVILTNNAANTDARIFGTTLVPVSAGGVCVVRVWARATPTPDLRVGVNWYDASKAYLSQTINTIPVTSSTYTEYTSKVTAPAGAYYGVVWINNFTASTSIRVDNVGFWGGGVFANSPGTTVIGPSGITVTNGALTVTNAGSVVIIDGTSVMFKVAAQGTTSKTVVNPSSTNIVTLTGLGALSATPASLCYLSDTSGNTGSRHLGHYNNINGSSMYAATTSGGAVTTQIRGIRLQGQAGTYLNASNEAVVFLTTGDAAGLGTTIYLLYYVLKEAAL